MKKLYTSGLARGAACSFSGVVLAAGATPVSADGVRGNSFAPTTVSTKSITRKRIFSEPLEAIGKPSAEEDRDLEAALGKFARSTLRDEFSALTDFIAVHPKSSWEMSLLSELGEKYYRTGHFSKALAA